MSLLVDTNILIDYLRDDARAVLLLRGFKTRPLASVVTVAELIAGAKSRVEEATIRALPGWVDLLPPDFAIADRAGQFLKHYRASHGIDDFDAVIAATAEQHGLELATLNVKHFPMFKKLKRAY